MCVRLFFRMLAVLALASIESPAFAQPVYFSGNGHYYELVQTQMTWAGAQSAAAALSHLSLPGHLVTTTSAAEDSFLNITFATGQAQFFAWIGGYEPDDDGVWLWGAGPESGAQFSQGGTATPPFNYVNWGGVEPNDFAPGEDYAAVNLGSTFAGVAPGKWIDSPNPNPADPIKGFIVEYESTPTGVRESPGRDRAPWLGQNTPNPFTLSTRIDYTHAADGAVSIDIFDVAGHLVRRVKETSETGGPHAVYWDGTDDHGNRLPAGIYFYMLRTGSAQTTKKLVIVR